MSTLVTYAKIFAIAAHEAVGQKRKFTYEPYYTHVIEVGDLLREFYMPASVIAAGYLHDTVEDTQISLSMIREHFGNEVTYIVDMLTEDKSIVRKTRKELTREKFKHAPLLVRCAKIADMISNTHSLPTHVDGDPGFKKWRDIYLNEQSLLYGIMAQFDPVDLMPSASHYRESYFDLINLLKKTIDKQLETSV